MDLIFSENGVVRFFIVSDIDPTEFLLNCPYEVTIVDENDIDQVYFGKFCSHFILSASTFHYWVALLSGSKNVYYFNDTDISSRNLTKGLGWKMVEQVEDSFDYYHQKDQPGNDIKLKNASVCVLKEIALKNENCVGFNTIGWLKNKYNKFTDFTSFGENEGFYLKNVCPKRYIFIHSCNLHGSSMLEYLLKNVDLNKGIEKIFINNIGPPIQTTFEKIEITNYSENTNLFEIPTINKMKQFSMDNPNCYILYLHTKGVSYNYQNEFVNDWINLMLHFLTKKDASNLLHYYDTIGCNYLQNEKVLPHWSGNFWWARSNYLRDLPFLDEKVIDKFSAELWLFKNKPQYYELHHSGVNHYQERYPKEFFEK
jgi:hypothetical protein